MLKQLVFLSFSLCLVAACSPSSLLTSNAPAETIYTLTPKSYADTQKPDNPGLLEINPVRVAPHLETDRILIKKDGRELDYYAGAKWASRTGDMVYGFLQRSLENRFGPVVVSSDDTRLHPDNVLQIEVRDFQAEYTGSTEIPPKIKVTLNAYILNRDSREQNDHMQFTKTIKAADNTLAAVTFGFEKAMRRVIEHIIDDLVIENLAKKPAEP
mgnify:CR=1 FL=1